MLRLLALMTCAGVGIGTAGFVIKVFQFDVVYTPQAQRWRERLR